MKRNVKGIIAALIAVFLILLAPLEAFAAEGSMGYEGGISTVNTNAKDEYFYSEMCFLSGVPVLLTGSLTIKKSEKNNIVTSTYTYKLSNTESGASLTRVVLYETTKETKANGQITESTKLSRLPTEVITINGTTYTLTNYSFSRSLLSDPKPALNYNAGEFAGKKTYTINGERTNTITVEMSGRIYSYDQYWSSTQTQKISYTLLADIKKATKPYQWGGAAEVTVSQTTRQQIIYQPNEPYQISFDGGYVRSTWTESTMDYTALMPEFDKSKMPTSVLKSYSNRSIQETEPILERLMVPDIKQIKGHWAEEPVRILFGLGVIPGTGENYKINKYLTRREFVAMLVEAVKDIPADPNLKKSSLTTVSRSSKKTVEQSPFLDVSVNDTCFAQIKKAYEKGITAGTGQSNFNPDSYITYAEAIKMIVASLGLENLAPYPSAVTSYPDNDAIPAYARNAAQVAYSLGIYEGDDKGYFNPSGYITNEKGAILFYNLINYMGDELVKDYYDRMLAY